MLAAIETAQSGLVFCSCQFDVSGWRAWGSPQVSQGSFHLKVPYSPRFSGPLLDSLHPADRWGTREYHIPLVRTHPWDPYLTAGDSGTCGWPMGPREVETRFKGDVTSPLPHWGKESYFGNINAIVPFYKGGNGGLKTLSALPQVTQVLEDKARAQTQIKGCVATTTSRLHKDSHSSPPGLTWDLPQMFSPGCPAGTSN